MASFPNRLPYFDLAYYLSQPNSTSTQAGSDKVLSRTTTTPTPPLKGTSRNDAILTPQEKLLRHFQASWDDDFWYEASI